MRAVADSEEPPLPRLAALADMRPCRRCGQTDRRRMVALMTLWFGPHAGVQLDHGYFYLCPACYETCIAPHLEPPHLEPPHLQPPYLQPPTHDVDDPHRPHSDPDGPPIGSK